MRGREWGYSPCWRKLLPNRENVHISSGSLISTIKSSTGSIPPHAHTHKHKHCILRVAHNSSAYSSVVVQKFQIFLSKIPNFEIFFNQIYIFYALQACWKFWIHILPKSRRLYWGGGRGVGSLVPRWTNYGATSGFHFKKVPKHHEGKEFWCVISQLAGRGLQYM